MTDQPPAEALPRDESADAQPPTPGAWDSPITASLRVLPYLLLFASISFGTALAGQRVTNPDTYFHLRYGAEFWGHWSPWHPGSVTPYATRKWLPTQWLGEIVMARFEAWFGLPGVAWLTGLWVLGMVLALFLTCRRWGSAMIASFATLFAVVGSAEALSGRPQVLSYLLMVVVVGAWVHTAEDGRPRWWLLAVAWVWPLLHGMWLLGLVTSFVAAIGVVLDRHRDLGRDGILRVLGLPVAMAVVSALTPLGPGLYGAVLEVGARGSYYSEWNPPNYAHDTAKMFAALLILLLIVAALRQRSANSWFVVAMVALTCAWAVYSSRTVPIAAVTAAVLVSYVVGKSVGVEPRTQRRDRLITLGMVTLGLVVLACAVPFTASKAPTFSPWIDRHLAALPQGTPVLSADYDGSVLMWTHPNVAVIAHGYGDSFTDAELARNKDLPALAPSWEHDLAQLDVKIALLPAGSQLEHALTTELDWRVEHQTKRYVYLVAPSS